MELMIPAVCAFILISNLLLAFFRGTRKSLLRLGTAVLAAVVAFFVARAIAAGVGDELALWLKDAAVTQELPADGDLIKAYLHGETVPCDKSGWCLVTTDGYSIGWGKADRTVLKNHYPKGLRR